MGFLAEVGLAGGGTKSGLEGPFGGGFDSCRSVMGLDFGTLSKL